MQLHRLDDFIFIGQIGVRDANGVMTEWWMLEALQTVVGVSVSFLGKATKIKDLQREDG